MIDESYFEMKDWESSDLGDFLGENREVTPSMPQPRGQYLRQVQRHALVMRLMLCIRDQGLDS